MEHWFSKAIIAWYQQNKRNLPWRTVKDPYKIWLSEIILQQTQVAQGLNYYLKFIKTYPTVTGLAKAHEDEVLKLWQGLGYYSRARNLHEASKTILKEYKGIFPSSYQEIRALKGVGDYTAAAIASFAYDLPHAVVDGNVYRVLSRIFGIETPIDSSQAKKEFQALADQLLDKENAGIHNQAIMEFGSQYCKPVNPDCSNCILKNKCLAFKTSKVSELPIKAKKTKIRNRFFNYFIIGDKKGKVIVNKRNGSDIWKGLYEFHLVETDKQMEVQQLVKLKEFKAVCNMEFTLKLASKEYKHILSHQHLYSKFYVITTTKHKQLGKIKDHLGKINDYSKPLLHSANQLQDLAFPRLIEKFLHDCDLKEMF
jgi:A/G-specific adenine glycosylase